MEDLPEGILSSIARQVLEKEEGMRLWCQLASTCTRLWSFQLPAEPAYLLDSKLERNGLPWALGRLREACKLSLTLTYVGCDGKPYLVPDVARALTRAAQGLTKLNTLVLLQELHNCGDAAILQDCQPWEQTLLLGATGLTALSTSTATLRGPPVIRHLPLCHLELYISRGTGEQLESYLIDISCCLTLESLKLSGEHLTAKSDFEALPSVHLHCMPRLKHVRLEDYLSVDLLSLPADCLLFLDVCSFDAFMFEGYEWQERWAGFQSHIKVLRLSADSMPWPLEIQAFSNLQCLDYFTMQICGQDLANLQHIPDVRVLIDNHANHAEDQLQLADLQHIPHLGVLMDDHDMAIVHAQDQLHLTSGSWQSLVVFFSGEFQLNITDIDSFVRDTRSFTFSSENTNGAASMPFQKIQHACHGHGKACHVVTHKRQVQGEQFVFITLSTSKEVAESCPRFRDKDQEEASAFDIAGDRTLFHWDDFWPCDPCASVKKEGKLWV